MTSTYCTTNSKEYLILRNCLLSFFLWMLFLFQYFDDFIFLFVNHRTHSIFTIKNNVNIRTEIFVSLWYCLHQQPIMDLDMSIKSNCRYFYSQHYNRHFFLIDSFLHKTCIFQHSFFVLTKFLSFTRQ